MGRTFPLDASFAEGRGGSLVKLEIITVNKL
jgi:hypothetical protein